jgi:hypothetical protein
MMWINIVLIIIVTINVSTNANPVLVENNQEENKLKSKNRIAALQILELIEPLYDEPKALLPAVTLPVVLDEDTVPTENYEDLSGTMEPKDVSNEMEKLTTKLTSTIKMQKIVTHINDLVSLMLHKSELSTNKITEAAEKIKKPLIQNGILSMRPDSEKNSNPIEMEFFSYSDGSFGYV